MPEAELAGGPGAGSADAAHPRPRARKSLRARPSVLLPSRAFTARTQGIARARPAEDERLLYFPTKRALHGRIERPIEGWTAPSTYRPEHEPREAIAAYIRAKLEYSRRYATESRFFANEILRGAQFLERRQRQHIRDVTDQRAHVVEEWIRRGQMAPVDPRHFFIMLWSATQFYADFGMLAADVLNRRQLTRQDFDAAAETMTRVILDGCCAPPASSQ